MRIHLRRYVSLFAGIVVTITIGFSCGDPGDAYSDGPYFETETSDVEADWSPNGQWIVYRHADYNHVDTTYPTGIYIIDSSGSNRELLVSGEAFSPAWSPDGHSIAFTSGRIYSIGLGIDSLQAISQFIGYFPSWSPDGQRIVFDTPYQDPRGANVIWTVDVKSGFLRDLSEHGIGEWRDPQFSPDGSQILHYRYIGIGFPEIFVMDTSGQNAVRLTFNNHDERSPSWSKDGSRISWTSFSSEGEAKIWVMNADGTNQREIASGADPSWSPSSSKLVISRRSPSLARTVLWIVSDQGVPILQLTN